jgi:hypothetical protein
MTPRLYPYAYDFDVENPMFCPDLSGRLQHHYQSCDECNGTGFEDYDEPEPCNECYSCVDGKRFWGSWYGEDLGRCGTCGADNALVAMMYEDLGDPDSSYVCLACYVRHHKETCGCDKWAWAEKILVLFMPSD